jgi:hypothetical protein
VNINGKHKCRFRVRCCGDAPEPVADGEWHFRCTHGGGVANSYGYRAETECRVTVTDPSGNCVSFWGRAPANKVTTGGAARACVGDGDLWDGRVTDEKRLTTSRRFLRTLHAKACIVAGIEVPPEIMAEVVVEILS